MNYRQLYTVKRFKPAPPTPANDRGTARSPATIRPDVEAREKHSASLKEEPVEIHRFVDLKAKREPLRYTIDSVVQRGRIYTLTGPTNAGKTAWCTMAALAVATGRSDILGLDVEKGRVAYLAIENPDDTISRFEIAQHFCRIPDLKLRDRLFIITVKATPESVFAALKRLAKSGHLALVVVDTLAAYFDGSDMNDNVAAGNFMRRLRALTTVLGNPAVVVPAHPTKGATQRSLVPYGGGAIVNEVDGNLTLWRRGDASKLHHQTKLRGPDFRPIPFRFRDSSCGEVLDAKGRRVVMPLLVPFAEEVVEPLALPAPVRALPRPQREQQRPREGAAPSRPRDLSRDRQRPARSDEANPDTKLLRAMIADPSGTQEEWAAATGVAKSNVNRRLTRLQGDGLVHGERGRWTVTAKAERAV